MTEEDNKNVETYEKINKSDSYAIEKALVAHMECNQDRPLCLYDFTLKSIMLDYQAFSLKDFSQIDVDQSYFYGDDYSTPTGETFIPLTSKSPVQIEETKEWSSNTAGFTDSLLEPQEPQEVSEFRKRKN